STATDTWLCPCECKDFDSKQCDFNDIFAVRQGIGLYETSPRASEGRATNQFLQSFARQVSKYQCAGRGRQCARRAFSSRYPRQAYGLKTDFRQGYGLNPAKLSFKIQRERRAREAVTE